jgi:translation initiation factor 1
MKRPTDGGSDLGQNPFGALAAEGLPQAKPAPQSVAKPAPMKDRGRVDVRRETAGRGGKTVTTVSGFKGIGLSEKEALAKEIRNRCGCGGAVKDGVIELQGDKRDQAAEILKAHGFRVVFTGG